MEAKSKLSNAVRVTLIFFVVGFGFSCFSFLVFGFWLGHQHFYYHPSRMIEHTSWGYFGRIPPKRPLTGQPIRIYETILYGNPVARKSNGQDAP